MPSPTLGMWNRRPPMRCGWLPISISLAAHVGLSRTALATRFRLLVGDSPMHYLTRVRLTQAAGLLATTRLSHHEIAHLTGYATDAALSKAFRRERGETLGAHRATARSAPDIALVASAI